VVAFSAFKRRAAPLLICFAVGATVGCASYTDETREIRSLYKGESYREALAKLEASSLKDEQRNRLLYRLEKAMILERLGEEEKARRLLIEADKIVDQLYTVSVSKTAASLVVNDSMSDYSGEDFEKVAIHTQLALSFLASKDLPAARVEAQKINNKLAEINQGYEDNKNKYGEDAFARYLAGVIYEARGELDDAIIDYGKAVALYGGDYSEFVDGGVPDNLVRAYARVLVEQRRDEKLDLLQKRFAKAVAQGKKDAEDQLGEVVVIHEAGHIATKTTEDFVIPVGKQVIRFSFPVIRKGNSSYFGSTGIMVDGGSLVGADNVQDMDAIAHSNLEDRRGRIIAKSMGRLLAKGQLTEQAYKNFGLLGGIAANIYSVASETADTRSWTLLPEAYFISRARLKPGKHTVKIQTGGRLGRIETIEIRKGKIEILRDQG
jgi:hypothetical protein